MASAKECGGSEIFYGSGRLLQKVYSQILKDSSPYHFLAKEGEEVPVD
jgi:hypothetical protein